MSMAIEPVYKFMSGECFHLKGLRENTVWFSSVKDLNDPYEGRVNLKHSDVSLIDSKVALTHVFDEEIKDLKKSRKEVESFLKRVGMDKFNEHVEKNTKKHFEDFLTIHHEQRHVLSLSRAREPLSENPIPEPLSLMMMWGHYANGFRGMCVEYDYHELIRSINVLNDIAVSAKPVDYIEGTLPIIEAKTILDDIVYKNGNTSREILRAYCTKHKAWDYENEVRVISQLHGVNRHSENSINRVFVSDQNPALIKKVKSILKTKKQKPELLKVSLHKKEFGFYFKTIEY